MATNLQDINLIDFLTEKQQKLGVFAHFQNTLFNTYNPDINGYTLLFMIPPELSGLKVSQNSLTDFKKRVPMFSPGTIDTTLDQISKFVTFAAVDYSPPQEQLNTEKISGRTGGIPYATEFTMSEQFSVTYIEDSDLSLYQFHQIWLYYIWDLVEGKLAPDDKYMNADNIDTHYYGALDYAASFYIVKYKPDLNTITYIGKCVGAFPQSLPSKELIGQRTGNELTTLPMQYFVSAYRSQVINSSRDGWLYNELYQHVLSKYTQTGSSNR